MLLQFPFICHRQLNRRLLFSAYVHLQSKGLVWKGLNLFMEKEITILPLEFLAQLLSWNRTATCKGKMYSFLRQLLLCIIQCVWESLVYMTESFRTQVLLASSSPPALVIRNSCYMAYCVTDLSLFPYIPYALNRPSPVGTSRSTWTCSISELSKVPLEKKLVIGCCPVTVVPVCFQNIGWSYRELPPSLPDGYCFKETIG